MSAPTYVEPGDDDLAVDDAPAVRVAVSGVGTWSRLTLSEPVRLRLYSVLVAVLGLLTAYGVVSDVQAGPWAALCAAVLGVGATVTESVRNAVWSPRTHIRELVDAEVTR